MPIVPGPLPSVDTSECLYIDREMDRYIVPRPLSPSATAVLNDSLTFRSPSGRHGEALSHP